MTVEKAVYCTDTKCIYEPGKKGNPQFFYHTLTQLLVANWSNKWLVMFLKFEGLSREASACLVSFCQNLAETGSSKVSSLSQ